MTHTKTFEAFVSEALSAKKPNEVITVDADMSFDNEREAAAGWKKFNLKVKALTGGQGTEHEIIGKKKDILAYLQSEYYEMDDEDIKEFYPELLEGNNLDEAMVQVAGKSKPSGAKVLAIVIMKYLDDNLLIPGTANKKAIEAEIAQLIMDSTF